MRQNEVFPYYRKCCDELEKQYYYMQTLFNDQYVDELCAMRGYVDEHQRNLIAEMKLGYCQIEDTDSLGDMRRELGLVSKKDNFLLNERFIVPVHNVENRIVALIGYLNDKKKYITTPSPYFSKECMFFNFHQAYELSWKEYNGFVILVEGIFDCLSLRSIGLPCIATMGASVSKIKCELLKLFKKVLAIPDDDATGRKALNRYSKFGWQVPFNTTFLKFLGGEVDFGSDKLHCKDMDNFVSWFEPDDVREILLSYYDSKEDIEVLKL